MRSVKEVAGLLVLLCLTKDTLKTREVCNHTATGCCGSQSPETKRNPRMSQLWSMDIMWSDNNFYSEHLSDNWLTALLPWEWLWILKAFWKLVMLVKKTLRLAGKRSPPSKAEMALSSSFSHSRESRPEKAPSLNVCESKQGNPSLFNTLSISTIYFHLS